MKAETKKVERKMFAALRDGRRLRKADLTAEERAALLADVDADYANRTGGLSQNLWDFAHENFKDEIDEQRQKHFAQEARQKKAREKLDAENLAQNLAGKAWAPIFIKWLEDRAFTINGTVLYPLNVEFWQPDCQKIVDEAASRHLPLSDEANLTDIIRNLARAGEIHVCDLLTGEIITGTTLLNYEPLMLNELLKPTSRRRDTRSAEEFLRTDPAILAEERRINDELTGRDRTIALKQLAATEPSFYPSPENESLLAKYLADNDLRFTQENLRVAFRTLWAAGRIGKIPNTEISTGVTLGRIWPDPDEFKNQSDEARDFRALVSKMSSEDFDAKVAMDSEFREKVGRYL